MPEAAIFDVDGTLVDSNELHALAWQRAFHRVGREIALDAIRPQIGKGADQLIPVFLHGAELRERGEEVERQKTEIFLNDYLFRVRPFPKVAELFARLRAQGTRIALATSAKEKELAAYRRICPGLSQVDQQTTADQAARSKPAPDIFAAALAQAGLTPRQAVVIGDSPYDAAAATRLGIIAIGLLCGGFGAGVLREAGCAAVYRDPEDLLANLDRSPLAEPSARVA